MPQFLKETMKQNWKSTSGAARQVNTLIEGAWGGGGRGGAYCKKIGWECAAHFPKPLPYLLPKFAIFQYSFSIYDLTLNQCLVSDMPCTEFPSF